ncbi:MAG: glutamine-hydrolyzing GMP synthase [archaeon]
MDKIIILDMGGQYAHLLARRIRQLGVYSEIKASDTSVDDLKSVKGIILSGGPKSVYDKDAPTCDPGIFSLNIPILGLCYGHQLIAQHYKGTVQGGKVKEYGIAKVKVTVKDGLFHDLSDEEQVWMSHGDEVTELPDGFIATAATESCQIAAMADKDRRVYGIQFHPEVTHTPHGTDILNNFITICDAKRDFSVKSYYKIIESDIKTHAKGKKVFLLVSGGVDSTTCYALLEKVLGPDNVHALFIDNGMVRKGEADRVRDNIERAGYTHLYIEDASDDFLSALKDVYEPEKKRKIIGEKFMEVQQRVEKRLGLNPNEWIIAQGTIYPDTIETKGTKHADLIKTHHNRVPLVQEMIEKGLVIEPLAGLYKDEVRELAREIGVPDNIVNRHPFPGPGLGVRCLCSKGDETIDNQAGATERIKALLPRNLSVKILPIRSVGVQGDSRSYRHPAVLWGTFPGWDILEDLSTKVTNAVRDVNRVLWLLEPTGDSHCVVKSGYLTKDRLDLLREADSIIIEEMKRWGIYHDIWQFPVVLVPLGKGDGESIILRPVTSREAMTARFAHLGADFLSCVTKRIIALEGIDCVMIDITNKPPGTIEWE